MPKTMKQICKELNISDVEQLAILRDWCHQHISKDIEFSGSLAMQFQKYYQFAEHYLEFFLVHLPETIEEPVHTFSGLTSLQYAVKSGYHYFIEQYPISKESLDKPYANLMTMLHMSASLGYFHTMNALLAKGAEPMLKNHQEQYPIVMSLFLPMIYEPSVVLQKKEIFKTLVNLAPDTLLAQDKYGDTVLHHLAEKKEFSDLLDETLKLAPKLAFIDNQSGRYPIHTAILNGQIEMTEYLLAIPGVGSLIDGRRRTLLHYAARYSKPSIVELCLKHADGIDVTDSEGKTPLMMACEAGKKDVAQYLLNHGASISVTDANGFNALDYATQSGDQKLIEAISRLKQQDALKPK